MNDIKITRWQPLKHDGRVIASFNFTVRGIIVRAALFQRGGGGYQIVMPFTQHFQKNGTGLTAVGLPGDVYHEVTAAAVAHYLGLGGEPDDAGLRRMIGETMAIAGL